jgi:hypothetical protein
MELADLSGADLSFANLSYTNLEGANLSGANLSSADLSWSNMRDANLRGANLTLTSLMMADLSGADLRGANIMNSDMESTILMNAAMGITRLINCDLKSVIGLDMVIHRGPSTVGMDSLARSGGLIPRKFLEGAGVASPLINAQDALRSDRRGYPTVLIIGCSGDAGLSEKIRVGLDDHKIPAWCVVADDEEAIQSGKIILSHASYYDSFLMLGTTDSLASSSTSQYYAELLSTTRIESKQNITVLVTDDAFFHREDRLCVLLKERQVQDFRGWNENEQSFQSLLDALAGSLSQDKLW